MFRNLTIAGIITWIVALLVSVSALTTHVIVCIKSASWILLAFGVIAPPIGIIHGIGQWFGVW